MGGGHRAAPPERGDPAWPIDFDGCVIHIGPTICEVSRTHSPTGQRYVAKDAPKDDEPRSLPVSEELIALLREHIDTYDVRPGELMFSFARRRGLPMSRNTFRQRYWKPAVRAAGLPANVRFHDLRHAHASWLLAAGIDLETVRERMGHASLATTQLYIHALPGAQAKAVAAIKGIRRRGHLRPVVG